MTRGRPDKEAWWPHQPRPTEQIEAPIIKSATWALTISRLFRHEIKAVGALWMSAMAALTQGTAILRVTSLKINRRAVTLRT